MGYKQVSPIPIIEGGTNNNGFPNPFGLAYYDGTKLNNIVPGTSGQILQSQGSSPAAWVDATAIGAVTVIDGNSGTATPSSGVVNIVGSGGITTSGSGATLTITGSGSGFTWNNTTGTTQTMAVANGYVSNNASLSTFTLPSSAAIGDRVAVQGSGAGGWTIAQNSGQTIHFNGGSSTTGTGGSVSSSNQYDSIELICNVANTDFVARNMVGNFTVV